MNYQKFRWEHEKIIEELQSRPEYFIKLSQLQLEFSDKKVFCIRMLEKVLDIQKTESVPVGAHMQFRNWEEGFICCKVRGRTETHFAIQTIFTK